MATVFEFAPTGTIVNGSAVPTNASIYDVINGNVTYDTGVVFKDLTASARCLNDAGVVATGQQALTAVTTRYLVRVMRVTAPTGGTFTRLTGLRNSTTNTGVIEVRVNDTRNLIVRDLVANVNLATSTSTITYGTNFRFELDVVGTQVTMRYYADAQSSTVTETLGPVTQPNGATNQIMDGVGTATYLSTVRVLYAADGDTSNPSLSRWAATDTTAPTVPSGLTATPSPGQVALSWTASTDANGVASYRIKRGGTNLTGATALTGTSFVDTTVTAGASYTYTVSAVDAAGNRSAESATASATVTALPPGLKQYCIVGGTKQLLTTRAAGTATVVPSFSRTVNDLVYTQYGAALRTDGRFAGWGKHEAELGISGTTYDWYHGARPGVAAPFPSIYDNLTYQYHNVWGQVIPVLGGMPAAHRDVRIQFDWPQAWHLEGGVWVLKKIQADIGNLDGGYWNGTAGNYSKTTDWTSTEPNPYWRSETVGYSFDAKPMTNADGTPKNDTAIAHFFFNGFFPRVKIETGSQVAIVTRMRLITDNPAVDVSQAKFVGCFSGDAFETATTSVGSNGRNPALAITRHIKLTDQWRHVGHVSGTEAQIRAYPTPPFLV